TQMRALLAWVAKETASLDDNSFDANDAAQLQARQASLANYEKDKAERCASLVSRGPVRSGATVHGPPGTDGRSVAVPWKEKRNRGRRGIGTRAGRAVSPGPN